MGFRASVVAVGWPSDGATSGETMLLLVTTFESSASTSSVIDNSVITRLPGEASLSEDRRPFTAFWARNTEPPIRTVCGLQVTSLFFV